MEIGKKVPVMKTEFWETRSGSCLLRMGMARQSPAADKPGGQLKPVSDASQCPDLIRVLAETWARSLWLSLGAGSPSAHPPVPQPQPAEDGFDLGVSFGCRDFSSRNSLSDDVSISLRQEIPVRVTWS